MKPIRILIADDHAVVLEGLTAMIGRQTDMTVIGQANNGEDAVAQWISLRPDISLLDLRMPALDAVGVMNRIRAEDSAARVIVLTTFNTDEDIYKAIRAGAKAYLLKDAPRENAARLHTQGACRRNLPFCRVGIQACRTCQQRLVDRS
jgi:DNA-binding NarL/FixJ family response regulator